MMEPMQPPPSTATSGPPRVTVIGASLAGRAAALAAHRAGLPVTVLEQAPQASVPWGAVALSPTAVAALDRLGVGVVRQSSSPIDALDFTHPDGRLIGRVPLAGAAAAAGAPLLLTPRDALSSALSARLPPGAVRYSARISGVQDGPDAAKVVINGAPAPAAVVVGADGLRSAVRQAILSDGPPRAVPVSIWAGWAPSQPSALRRRALIVVGPHAHAIALPAPRGRTWWLVGLPSQARVRDRFALQRALSGWAGPIKRLVSQTPGRSIRQAALFDRPPSRLWGRGRITLAGDAAHPCAPHLGQGASMSLEDAAALGEALALHGATPAALRAYEAARQPVTAAIVGQAAWTARTYSSRPAWIHLVNAGLGPTLRLAVPLLPALVRAATRAVA